MEFYGNCEYGLIFYREFQFPTGWNSTLSDPCKDRGSAFQFPTGWNSTDVGAIIFNEICKSFNSQRDGILPITSKRRFIPTFVSIPNGMEFYTIPSALILFWSSFQFPTGWNSTRSLLSIAIVSGMFQFPTGWNSTLYIDINRCKNKVSIPNGMEFYELGGVWS